MAINERFIVLNDEQWNNYALRKLYASKREVIVIRGRKVKKGKQKEGEK